MNALKESIIEKLDALPSSALQEVLDFVNFLAWKDGSKEGSLLSVAGKLSGQPISGAEIDEELYGGPRR